MKTVFVGANVLHMGAEVPKPQPVHGDTVGLFCYLAYNSTTTTVSN